MTKKIDTKKPIRFYDDRGKVKEYFFIEKILYEDNEICVVLIQGELHEEDDDLRKIMFKKQDGQVMNGYYDSWYAENYETEQTKLAKKAIKHVKEAYVDDSKGHPSLLLGDVAKLIEIITGIKVTLDELEIKK
jgi:hypothetical protein